MSTKRVKAAPKTREPYALYEHDMTLPDHFNIPLGVNVRAEDVMTLYALILALQERGLMVMVHAQDDDAGARLAFSTHPDTIDAEVLT